MSAPPVPPFFEHPGRRPFSFYPPIRNVPHNKWFYRKATWSEVLVENTRTHEEVWIPRRYMGDVTRLDEPVMLVALLKELELQAGRILPAQRRVIEMPLAVNESTRSHSLEQPPGTPVHSGIAPVIGIRVEDGSPSRVLKFLVGGISMGIVGCVLLVSFYRGGILGNHMYVPVLESDLGLGALDGRDAVIRKLGEPSEEHWRAAGIPVPYGVLAYPRRGLYIILRGSDRRTSRYIGAMDRNWNPLRSVELPEQGDSSTLLRSLRRD
jgi:hypothetical protein